MKLFSILVITTLSFNVFGYGLSGRFVETCSPNDLSLMAKQMNDTKEVANQGTPDLVYSGWKQTVEQFHRCRRKVQHDLRLAVGSLHMDNIDRITVVLKDVHKLEPKFRSMISQKATWFIQKGKEAEGNSTSPHLIFGHRLKCLAKNPWTLAGTTHCSGLKAH